MSQWSACIQDRSGVRTINSLWFVLLLLGVATIAAGDPSLRVELNATESVQQNHR